MRIIEKREAKIKAKGEAKVAQMRRGRERAVMEAEAKRKGRPVP